MSRSIVVKVKGKVVGRIITTHCQYCTDEAVCSTCSAKADHLRKEFGGKAEAAAPVAPVAAPKYPEHDKLRAVKPQSQLLGAFLDWLKNERGYELCELSRERGSRDQYEPVSKRIEVLLADYFDIDLDVIGREKDAMLEAQRALNERRES